MEKFSIKSIVLKWYYFWCVGSVVVYSEFSHLYMKQLGLSPRQIGFTNLVGVPSLFIPLCLFIGDKFRARKLLVTIGLVFLVVCYFLPLLPLIFSSPAPSCLTSNKSIASRSKHSVNGSVLSINSRYFSTNNFTDNADSARRTEKETSYSENVSRVSKLFLLMVVSKSAFECPHRVVIALADVVTIAYLKGKRANYGAYFMWSHIGGGISIFTVAMLALFIRINICGTEAYGYFTAYIVAGCMVLLSMLSLPWLRYEYDENKTINWSQIKSALCNAHFALMFFILYCTGILVAFQIFWELWYLDGLSASPLIVGIAGLVRRPVLAGWMLLSCELLKRIGELKAICVALFLFAVSFLALSFTRVPWFVLAIDIFQAAAYGLAFCSFTVHFSKAGSKANSGVIRGKSFFNSFPHS
ncbi:Hypothetical predicted protein [Paramuricea clavata]|uniref:Major facilitator superfamily associated domain-containing protein n=1 Tax=Paramuricea clavata TaxID=317549 RepID=A0A6S7JCJ5_PARCT|nr:Hypothetical predicted protein [Paramuricea clavata]